MPFILLLFALAAPAAAQQAPARSAFNWSGRRLDRSGRVFDATEPLMPIVPSAGFVVDF